MVKKLHLASQIFKIEAALEKAGNQHCLSNWHPLIGSRSIFDEDHDIFRSSVRKFMRNELAPEHKRYEAQVCIYGSVIWAESTSPKKIKYISNNLLK